MKPKPQITMEPKENPQTSTLTLTPTFIIILLISIAFLIARIILGFTQGPASTLIWFCVTLLLLFPIGLYLKNNLIISSIVTSGFVLNLALSIELISFTLTGTTPLGIGTYIINLSLFGYLATFYHLLLLIAPAYIIIKTKTLHKKAWLFSSFHLLILSLITLFLTDFSENCVRTACELGFFNFLYLIKPAIMPLFVFNWLAITLIIFIPTQLVFYYIIKKREITPQK